MTIWEIVAVSLAFGAASGFVEGIVRAIWRTHHPRHLRMTWSDPANDRVLVTADMEDADDLDLRRWERLISEEGWELANIEWLKENVTP